MVTEKQRETLRSAVERIMGNTVSPDETAVRELFLTYEEVNGTHECITCGNARNMILRWAKKIINGKTK